jgi:hypothetical protein
MFIPHKRVHKNSEAKNKVKLPNPYSRPSLEAVNQVAAIYSAMNKKP